MLQLTVDGREIYDESTMGFISVSPCILQLEHSLISLAKWESRWHKPFLTNDPKTFEELLDYVKCMTLNKNIDPNIYLCLTQEHFDAINSYIQDPMTATTINKKSGRSSRKIITSEVIYYWMIASEIPFECEKWHLNRLMTLIEVCSAEANPTKMSKSEIRKQNAAINAARRAKTGSRG